MRKNEIKTKENIREWIKNHLDIFPFKMSIEDYDNLTDGLKSLIENKLISIHNKQYPNKIKDSWRQDYKFTKTELNKLKIPDPFLPPSSLKRIESGLIKAKQIAEDNKPIKWVDINERLKKNFKKWVDEYAETFDVDFLGRYFDDLPDDIKLEWIAIMGKKFGLKTPGALKKGFISAKDMIDQVQHMRIPNNIHNAILDILPESAFLQTINKSDMSNWDAKEQVAFAKSLSQEELKAARENRKIDKKRVKLLAKARTIKSLESYQELLSDPLFDRDMLEMIIKRMERKTAFDNGWGEQTKKEILKLVVTHPFLTYEDLKRIEKVKSNYNNSQKEYVSKELNAALASQNDLPESDLMKLVKKQQFDIKVIASKRDLKDENKEILIDYTIKHHSHMPEQLEEVFSNLSIKKDKYKKEIIETLYSKYMEKNWLANGIRFLEVVDKYNWLSEIDEELKSKISRSLVNNYKDNRISQDRLIKMLNKISAGVDYLMKLYEETGDDAFLPSEVKDIFIF